MKAIYTNIFMIILLSSGLGFVAGLIAATPVFISECKKDGRMIFYNNIILECQVYSIDDVLDKNYWERME